MKKLLPCTALVMCAGMACAQAEEKNNWHFNIGAMYEIENVEGYIEDMDGLAEPSVYFNAANGPWRISLAYYQEGPVDYSAGKRGTWFDRPELEFEAFRPQVMDVDKPLPHIRLDAALEFLIGDKLR
ncbi:OmpG family monomeric porin [Escherichia coli]|nr:OmpG family monomeric porin [Escherichia coli]